MIDSIVVGLIVAGALAYIVYRYGFKKSGGCNCSCGGGSKSTGGCCGGDTKAGSSCACHK